ncbi:MAG: response regulator receiver protein [Candidatus Saccharibacteria bacterium]|nr:response regulator receiver protein [Candidatus Saccharibacteria bacterium]
MTDQPTASATPTTTPAAGRNVLCIEDEHFIGELYDRALTKGGYKVTVIGDGVEALAAAQTNQYDIILLDLMVPNLTGIEILRTLRDPARVPALKSKIVITTNLEQREDVRADIEKQADGYLVKAEITPHELVDFLNHMQ